MRLDITGHRAVAAILAIVVAMPAPATVVAATRQAPATAKAAAPAPTATAKPATPATPGGKPAAAAARPAAPVDGQWPRVLDVAGGGTILVYQPQVASWD